MNTQEIQDYAKQIIQAVNWNRKDDEFTLDFWNQNFQQIWSEEEISVSGDLNTWGDVPKKHQLAYKRTLGGLTYLDTHQGAEGMPLIQLHTKSEQRKAVLSLMGFMEHVHAKSYSSIFSTLASTQEIDDIFKWTKENPYLQRKGDIITRHYHAIFTPYPTKKDLYMALVSSVFLESFLFYSGFFLPLWYAGQGKLTASGEIINLIIRDESIHGLYTGVLAQELYNEFDAADKKELDERVEQLLVELYENEELYTHDIYSEIELTDEVTKFIRYNANRAMMNLGREAYFPVESINPIVENGLKTDTKNHDFFSVKGNGYIKTLNVEPLEDEDFVFEIVKEFD